MLNSQRIFVSTVRKYCASHGIDVDVRLQGWLIVMRRGPQHRLAFGYDLGLNSAVAHRIANDKAATADILAACGIACVPHTLFLGPKLSRYVAPANAWEAMLGLLAENPDGIVVKPNEGTGGASVFMVRSRPELEQAVYKLFASELSLAISPFLRIDEEVRVVLIDRRPIVVYSKNRLSVTGDGKRSLLQLALQSIAPDRLSAVLPGMVEDLDRAALDAIPRAGERRILNWRHNLAAGAEPVVLTQGDTWQACIDIAVRAATAIDLRFGSVDVVRVAGAWRILEINSGVMMEALGKLHPELVEAAYGVALDNIFS